MYFFDGPLPAEEPSSKASEPVEDPVQQVIDLATDLLQRLTLDQIVRDRIEMKHRVSASDEHLNSDLEVMDLALKNLLERDPMLFREVAERFLSEQDRELRDTGARMLLQNVQQTGNSDMRQRLEWVLVTNYTHSEALELMLDATDASHRAVIELMMHLVLHYNRANTLH